MALKKITDPKKVVTDPVMLKTLAILKIDKDYVEFHEDYNAQHPFAKVYKDQKSDKMFQVISRLPKVRKTDGKRIDARWYKYGVKYYNKPNLFDAVVEGTRVTVTAMNDQPNGTKAGDIVSWNPQLFIDGILQTPSTSQLLPVDPQNENYQDNVLEWDYGVCKRRLRIIEGRILEKWIFEQKPFGRISIKHNQSGEIKLRLGYGIDAEGRYLPIEVVDDDKEHLDVFGIDFPIEIGGSPETFYPDANPESTSVDGDAQQNFGYQGNQTWAACRAGAGTHAYPSGSSFYCMYFHVDYYTDKWMALSRGILLFDTSSLPDDCDITDAVLSIRGSSKHDDLDIPTSARVNIYASAPADNDNIVAGDFNSFQNSPFSDDDIYYNVWDLADYNDFILNTTGKNAISKTAVSKFGVKDVYYDNIGVTPPWDTYASETNIVGYSSEQGDGYKPKLVVTYTPSHVLIEANSQSITAAIHSAVISVSATVIATLLTLSAVLNASTVRVDYTHTPDTQTLSLTQNASTQKIDYVLYADAPQTITFTQYSSTVMAGEILSVNSQEINLTQNPSTQKIDYSHSAAVQSISLTQNSSTVVITTLIEANLQTISLTQNAPTVKSDFLFLPDTLSISITQKVPSVKISFTHEANEQTLSYTQYAPSYILSQVLSPETQELTLTINEVTIPLSQVLEVSVQSLSLTQNAPELIIGYTPATKDLSVTQMSPSLSADQILSALTQEIKLTQLPILIPAYRLVKCTFVTRKPDITITARKPNVVFTAGG